MLAINGSEGIGTGYNTKIPAHKPEDVIALIRGRLTGQLDSLDGHALDPWWAGFKGHITRVDQQKWVTHGVYEIDEEKQQIHITELPVGLWTKHYKEDLDAMCASDEAMAKSGLRNFEENYNDIDVRFTLHVTDDIIDMAQRDPAKFEKQFGLTSSWNTTNMICFDEHMNIVRYDTVGDMIEAFFGVRYEAYEERKRVQLEQLEKERIEIDARRRFLQAILNDELTLIKQTDEKIVEQLQSLELPPLSDPEKVGQVEGYEYLLRMRIDRVKASAIADLEQQYAEHTAMAEELRSKSAADLWLADLDQFEAAWKAMAANRQASAAAIAAGGSAAGGKKGAKKMRVVVRR
jgi:DNA topoisomerase-2